MSGCRDGCAPIDNRTTTAVGVAIGRNAFNRVFAGCVRSVVFAEIFNRTASTCNTEHSVLISALCTGGCLALSIAGSANVEAPLILSVRVSIIAIHFCLNHSFVCREGFCCAVGICYNTCFSANYQSVISCTVRPPHCVWSQNVILILFSRIIGNVILTDTAIIQPALCHPDTNR